MGHFSGAKKVDANGGGTKFKPGIYQRVRIDRLLTKDGFHGLRAIAECTVLDDGAATECDSNGVDIMPNAAGSSASWTPRIDGQYGDIGMGEVKALVGLLHGMSPDEANQDPAIEEKMERAYGPDNPFAGAILSCEAYTHTTKNGKMMKVKWADLVELPSESPAQPAPPAPAPESAPTPPAPSGPPAGWFEFPEGDARRATHYYNASGETMEINAAA